MAISWEWELIYPSEYDLNWDEVSYKENTVSPVVATVDNPNTPLWWNLNLLMDILLKFLTKEISENSTIWGFIPEEPPEQSQTFHPAKGCRLSKKQTTRKTKKFVIMNSTEK